MTKVKVNYECIVLKPFEILGNTDKVSVFFMKYFISPDKAMPSEITADWGEGGHDLFLKNQLGVLEILNMILKILNSEDQMNSRLMELKTDYFLNNRTIPK